MWEFLWQPAGFDIGETGLLAFDASQPLWRALLVGLGNTLRVALPGLILCTLLALAVALLRRHGRGAWRGMAVAYIEVVRNVPLLLQLLIWYFLVIEVLPDSVEALSLGPGIWLSKGGLAIPWPQWDAAGLHWSIPEQGPFNVSGGAAVSPEFLALLAALSVYTSAFLAEVIRAGLDAVPASLLEAAIRWAPHAGSRSHACCCLRPGAPWCPPPPTSISTSSRTHLWPWPLVIPILSRSATPRSTRPDRCLHA